MEDVISQLYGSTTVVMATHGLHWKWQFDPIAKDIRVNRLKKIFGTIDYVIDLNNLAKFGFGKIFPDWGTHTQHIRVRPFFYFFYFLFIFLTFYALWWGCSQNGWTDFEAQYVIRRNLVRVRTFFKNKKYRSMTLTLKRSKSAILFDPKNFDPNFLETVRDREKVSIEVR